MNTSIQTKPFNVSSENLGTQNVEAQKTMIANFWEMAEFNRFGIITILLVVVACLGGFAAAITVQEGTFRFAVVAFSTMAVETTILAVMPMRTIIITAVIFFILSSLAVIL